MECGDTSDAKEKGHELCEVDLKGVVAAKVS